MKWYSTLPKSPELEPHHRMPFSVIRSSFLFFGDDNGCYPSNGDTVRIFSASPTESTKKKVNEVKVRDGGFLSNMFTEPV